MTCALYRHYDDDGRLLYVGVSDDPARRTAEHKARSAWFDTVSVVRVEWFHDRASALLAELDAIGTEIPVHNVRCDGKLNGAARFIDRIGKHDLSRSLGVTFAAVRNAHWRDVLPASWAFICANICVERDVECPASAFSWRGVIQDSRCISEVMGLRQPAPGKPAHNDRVAG